MTAGLVCLRSLRISPGVRAFFALMGTSERLPTRTTGDVWSATVTPTFYKNKFFFVHIGVHIKMHIKL
jgi:hypothetical protein